ncbi:GntR family transcriptional regulator, partial [Serratia ureilytica]|nr:GntR family transcriptional regulator [Serratia ureilytica]
MRENGEQGSIVTLLCDSGERYPDTRYLQLADTLAEAIRRGTLQPGDRLPSVRRCAQTHRVSIEYQL